MMVSIKSAIAAAMVLLLVTGCATNSQSPIAPSPSSSQTTPLEVDRAEVESVVRALSGALLLGSSWEEICDESFKYDLSLTTFYCIMNPDSPTEIPAEGYETFIQGYFNVSADFLREMQDYDAAKNVYVVSVDISVDRAVKQAADYLRIDSVEPQDNQVKVYYRTIWGNMAASGDGTDTAAAGYVLLEREGNVYRVCAVNVTETNYDKYDKLKTEPLDDQQAKSEERSAPHEFEFQCECDTGGDMFQEGTYVDGVIIRLIGREHYEQWLEDNLHEEATVYKLVEDFGLSWDELKSILHESVYTKYMENMPKG